MSGRRSTKLLRSRGPFSLGEKVKGKKFQGKEGVPGFGEGGAN